MVVNKRGRGFWVLGSRRVLGFFLLDSMHGGKQERARILGSRHTEGSRLFPVRFYGGKQERARILGSRLTEGSRLFVEKYILFSCQE